MVEKQNDFKILALRSDRGGEFLADAFSAYLHEHGIMRQLTTAYTPSQNGVSERKNRTILNMVRAMLISGSAPKFLWTEAAHTAVQILNSLPTKSNNGITLDEKFTGLKPDLSSYRIFGCLAFVHLDKSKRDKLSPRSILGIHLGLDDSSKAYRVYIPSIRKVQITRDVIFDESRFLNTQPTDSTFSFSSLFSLTGQPVDDSSDDESELDKVTLETSPNSPDLEKVLPASSSNPTDLTLARPLASSSQNLSSTSHPTNNSNFSDNPYHIDSPISNVLPKINFTPYHSIMDDLEEWPTVDRHNTLSPVVSEEDILSSLPTPSSAHDSLPLVSIARTSTRSRQPPNWLREYFVGFIEDTSEPASF
jgi:hypothetical protein